MTIHLTSQQTTVGGEAMSSTADQPAPGFVQLILQQLRSRFSWKSHGNMEKKVCTCNQMSSDFCRRSDLFLSKSVWKHLVKQSFKNSVAGITLWNILKRSHLWSPLANTGSSEGSCWRSLWKLTLQTDLLLPNSFAKWAVGTSPVCEGFFFRHCILDAISLLPTLKFFLMVSYVL